MAADIDGNPGQTCDGDIVKTLLLFACSAKLWLTIQSNRKQNSSARKRHNPTTNGSYPRSPTLGQSTNRRCRLNKRNNYNNWSRKQMLPPSPPDDALCNTYAQTIIEKRRKYQSDVNRQLGCMEESQRLLVERMSISDSVLTRENSLDFHPKNSNWSHFEGFTPALSLSPSKHTLEDLRRLTSVSEEEDGEDFLWSEPPTAARDRHVYEYTDKALQNQMQQSSIDVIRDFNSKIMPSRLIMVRHGQSEGNVDEALYSKIPGLLQQCFFHILF